MASDATPQNAPHGIGSMFSGIGGLELALESVGVGPVRWQVEIEEFQRAVLAKHWPNVTRYEDVTSVDWSTVEKVETICGGFPCQPFSEAGHRRGVLDDRWMWPAMADAIRGVGPRYVVVENVAALVRDADAFGRVLGDLHDLGFDAEWSVVPACAVGAPHSRPRLYLLAYPQGDHVPDQGAHGPETWQAGRTEPRGSGRSQIGMGSGWLPEPAMDRVAHGLPRWMVRRPLEGLGNAVVPAAAAVVGRRLVELREAARVAA